jgi:hypothetical protein
VSMVGPQTAFLEFSAGVRRLRDLKEADINRDDDLGARGSNGGEHSKAAMLTVPRGAPKARMAVRHRVSGTNRRARGV